MFGHIFITQTGYDPERGGYVKDPYLDEDTPSIGACRPDLRRRARKGDYFFTISGKVKGINQFVMGGFEVESKIPAIEAFKLFPEQRLHRREDGQLAGNIIVNSRGEQHRLDNHMGFDRRTDNYVVGKKGIAFTQSNEIAVARAQTLETLQDIFKKRGKRPIDIVGRWGSALKEVQVCKLLDWLKSVKQRA